MSIQNTLAQVRAKYGPSPSTNECGAICNETAWIHRNDPERWGISGKTSGNHAVLPDGTKIACDIIQNGVTREAYDVLVAAGDGGPATPAWNAVGVITDPNRPWLPPINPGTDPDNGGGNGGTTCKFAPTDLSGISASLSAIAADLARIEAKIDGLTGGGDVPEGVAMAQRQEELCDLTAGRIQASTDAILAAVRGIKSCIFRK